MLIYKYSMFTFLLYFQKIILVNSDAFVFPVISFFFFFFLHLLEKINDLNTK